MPIYKKVNKDFFKKWTPEMAYVLGFFAADGYITVNRRGGQFWCIQIADRELLERIRSVVESGHRIGVRKSVGMKKTLYRLQIGSIEMCNDLRKLGYDERKTKSLAVPHVPQACFPDFVRGYFDGDGNVWKGYLHKERKVRTFVLFTTFTSCSFRFLISLQKRLKIEGLRGGAVYKKAHYARLRLTTADSLKLYDFMYNREVVSLSGLFLQRKKVIFEGFSGQSESLHAVVA